MDITNLSTKKDLTDLESRIDKKIDTKFKEHKKSTDLRMDKQFTKMNKSIDERFKKMQEYLDFRLEPLDTLVKDFYEFRSNVFDKLDWLIGQYKRFDEEHTVLTESYGSNARVLSDHAKRIKELEQFNRQFRS